MPTETSQHRVPLRATELGFRLSSGRYCTVSLRVVDACNVPLVALTVTVLVPGGVPCLGGGLLLLPPHATQTVVRLNTEMSASICKARDLRPCPAIVTIPRNPGNHIA